MKRLFLFFILSYFISALYADEKLEVRNMDAGDSFGITIADNLKIYEYNSNWLDSVPYLIEHAKWWEPWAHEALADCYRYGKGGLEKSMSYALNYYKLSGKKMGEILKQESTENPNDELILFSYFLLNFLDDPVLDFESLQKELSTLKQNDFRWLNLIKHLSEMNKEELSISDLELFYNEDLSIDETVIMIGIIANQKLIENPDEDPFVNNLMEKLSMASSIFAEQYLAKLDEDNVDLELVSKILHYYKNADNFGVLKSGDLKNILYIKEIPGTNFYDYFSSDDLNRFEKLATFKSQN